MLFRRAIPPGPDVAPEAQYTGLNLSGRAHDDRPYLVCNFVSSADGKATVQGRTTPLSTGADQAVFHLLRTQVDGLLAGTETLRVSRYGLPVRDEHLQEIRVREGRAPQPLSVVISRSGDIPFDIPLFGDPRCRVALYSPREAGPGCADQLTHHQTAADNDLAAIMQSLRHEHEVRSILCEGGPMLFNALLSHGLVDELFLTITPAVVGGSELGITTGESLPGPQPMKLVWALECDGDLFLRYAR